MARSASRLAFASAVPAALARADSVGGRFSSLLHRQPCRRAFGSCPRFAESSWGRALVSRSRFRQAARGTGGLAKAFCRQRLAASGGAHLLQGRGITLTNQKATTGDPSTSLRAASERHRDNLLEFRSSETTFDSATSNSTAHCKGRIRPAP